MIGNAHFDQLVSNAPVNFDSANIDWPGYAALMETLGVDPGSVLAATWCRFSTWNIEALVDSPALTIVHSRGILSSVGKKKLFSGNFKYDEIQFAMCKAFGPDEYVDERGFGKYCIEFAGPGNVLLGRLWWSWQAKRFRDSRMQIMAVATERDRILNVVQDLLGEGA
jgi:hypothetical protein